jgi:diguanylate cyclase (GGDEF)-like protein/PAS domain S-box-containing protein
MTENTFQVLLIEDNPGDVRLIQEMLKEVNGFSFDIKHASYLKDGLALLSENEIDVIVLDLTLPDSQSSETFSRTQAVALEVPIVLLTGLDDEELGIQAMRDGAQDYLVKGPLDGELLARALRYAIERKRAVDALRASEQLFEKMFTSLRDAVIITDDRLNSIKDCNRAATETFSCSRDEVLSIKLDQFFLHPKTWLSFVKDLLHSDHTTGIKHLHQAEMKRKNEDCFYAEYSLVPLEDDHDKCIGWVIIIRDITARKQAEETLRESQERYMLAMRGANDGLWDWDLKTDDIYFSPRWKNMLGYEEDEISNSPQEWFQRIHVDDRSSVRIAINSHVSGASSHLQIEYRIRHKDQSFRWMLCRGLAVRDQDGIAYRMAGSQTDVTDQKKAKEQLQYDAFHDNLTGIANRALFLDRLGMAIEHNKRRKDYMFGVLFLDLDRFKNINDSLGHLIGDQLLVQIATRLKGCLRSGDTLARFGGDEFVMLLEDIEKIEDTVKVAHRVQQQLEKPYIINGQKVFTSSSIGIVLSTIGYQSTDEVVRDADIAMYEAKSQGRARITTFSVDMRKKAMARMELENDLHHALDRNEFFLEYQPYISLHDNRIVGFEALLRWQHPLRGLIFPNEFIPVVEESDLIFRVGHWVLHEACSQMSKWHQQFKMKNPPRINVNISSRQFSQPDFLDEIKEILEQTGLPPESLGLEITENVLMDPSANVDEVVKNMQKLGVKLQIDDFGTGYSSLGYLQRFPIATLKIDQIFINRLDSNGDRANIVKTILALANELGMEAVAEGVENLTQLEKLKEMKCPYVQGYYVSKPIDQEHAFEMLKNNSGMTLDSQVQKILNS